MRLAPGVELADGRYRLERRLGVGGMAAVWLARDTRLDRLVAIKVIADTLADDESWLLRFRREAQAAAALSHPNIVQVFDYGIDDGRPFLVMEHVEGANLAERLADPAGRAARRVALRARAARGARARTRRGHRASRHQAGEHPARRARFACMSRTSASRTPRGSAR